MAVTQPQGGEGSTQPTTLFKLLYHDFHCCIPLSCGSLPRNRKTPNVKKCPLVGMHVGSAPGSTAPAEQGEITKPCQAARIALHS